MADEQSQNHNMVAKRKKPRKKLYIALAMAVVVILVVVAISKRSTEKGIEVTAGYVERGDIIAKVIATGRVKPKTEVKIQASVQATIVELPVKEGDTVKAGDLLVKLDQTRYEAAVRMAKAGLASARAAMKQSEANMIEAEYTHKRAENLFSKGLMSEEQKISAGTAHEVAKARFESTRYDVEHNEANVVQAEDQLSKTVLRSPMTGIITELNAEVGEIVLVGTMNNPGTVIMTVADLSIIEVEAEVDETDIAAVRPGQNAKIKVDAFSDASFVGVVTEVGNAARISGYSTQDQVANFLVKVQFVDVFRNVKSGMTAEVSITTNEHFNVLHVPIQAVVMRDELPGDNDTTQPEVASGAIAAETESVETGARETSGDKDKEYEGVFMIRDGKASFVQVGTGIADQRNIEITSGVSDSASIVTGPYKMLRKLKHGDRVRIQKWAGDEEQ